VGLVFGSSCPRTGGRDKDNLPQGEIISDCEGNRKKSRAQKIAEARRVGAPRRSKRAERSEAS
jgi:hypothetical protein